MAGPRTPAPQPFEPFLQRGQALEQEGRFDEALAAYDHALTLLRATGDAADPAARHALGIVWMNRGNALQRIGTAPSLADAVRAYDEAIAAFRTLPLEAHPSLRNHLGAAWLNRGHALVVASDSAAIDSFENAIAELAQLPLEADPYFRLNLAGAHTNLALATLGISAARAADAARAALQVLAEVERAHEAFAAMSLRARHALVLALNALLNVADATPVPAATLLSEATDAIDDGLALARDLEQHGSSQHRPIAHRLFRLGAQLYGSHQPHFLGEFVLEHLSAPAFAADEELRATATAAIEQALVALQPAQPFIAGTPEADRRLATARSLRAAQQQLSALGSPLPAPSP